MTLEEAKEELEYRQDRMRLVNYLPSYNQKFYEAIDTVLKALEEIEIENENLTLSQLDLTKRNISKDEIREKIKDLQENNNGDDYNLTNVVNILKELLGE